MDSKVYSELLLTLDLLNSNIARQTELLKTIQIVQDTQTKIMKEFYHDKFPESTHYHR